MTKHISNEELLEELVRVADKLGRIPSYTDIDNESQYCAVTYRIRFGSIHEAHSEAGLPSFKSGKSQLTKQKLMEDLQRTDQKIDRNLRPDDIVKHATHSMNTYITRFENLDAAFEAAGVERYEREYPTGEDHYRWSDSQPLDYGDDWDNQREKALQRDNHSCQDCGMSREEHRERFDTDLHVHHRRPFREFSKKDSPDSEAHKLENLITLCCRCHRQWEQLPVQPPVD